MSIKTGSTKLGVMLVVAAAVVATLVATNARPDRQLAAKRAAAS